MYEIIKNAQEYGLTRVFANTRDFIETMEELRNKKDEIEISDLIKETLNKTGYTKALELENTVEAESRIQNLEELLTVAIELVLVLAVYSMDTNAAFKLPWIILITVAPIVGICVFFLFGRSGATKKVRARYRKIDQQLFAYLNQDEQIIEELSKKDERLANDFKYLWKCASSPVYKNTDVKYYGDTCDAMAAQLEDMMQAKKFIFLEYHAIEMAESFQALRKVLMAKAREGVEIRILYDDAGCIGFLNPRFIKYMESMGIQCRVFNPIMPVLNIFMNNRDHRKITVIDGKVAYTGGYNLADEYFNITHPYGQWKDSGIRFEGDAVQTATILFLEMWNALREQDVDIEKYLPVYPYKAKEQGFFALYGDSPLDKEPAGENVYMNLLRHAKKYIYFTTPYLILSDEMTRELTGAAKRGVDVRIITPGIPDKKTIFQVTKSYYPQLLKHGVKIYEYTPGFMHEKQCICDGEIVVVGTINLDFRSLYLHFENAALFCGYEAVSHVKEDFDALFPICKDMSKEPSERTRRLRLSQLILRLFSPLM